MTTDAVWAAGGAGSDVLCVGCFEERLGRTLEPADFPPLPVNDDDETDSVRLRTRKGSGRRVEALYRLATDAVLDLGTDVDAAASALEIDAGVLALCVDQARFGRAVLAEIEAAV